MTEFQVDTDTDKLIRCANKLFEIMLRGRDEELKENFVSEISYVEDILGFFLGVRFGLHEIGIIGYSNYGENTDLMVWAIFLEMRRLKTTKLEKLDYEKIVKRFYEDVECNERVDSN